MVNEPSEQPARKPRTRRAAPKPAAAAKPAPRARTPRAPVIIEAGDLEALAEALKPAPKARTSKAAPRRASKATTKPRKSTPRALDLLERQKKALEMRRDRYTFEQIAAKLGYSDRGGAWHDVQNGMKEIIREPAEMVRDQELAQLDEMYAGLRPGIMIGDTKAITAGLKIQERRSKLLGLDAPTQTNITGAPFSIVVDPDLLPENANLGAIPTVIDG